MYSGEPTPILRINAFVGTLLMIVFGFFPGKGEAQELTPAKTIIRGVVTDAVTHEPLTGVLVIFPGTSNGTTTDAEGEFALETKEAYAAIQIRFLGYKTIDIPVQAGQVQELKLKMQAVNEQLEEVVIVASKRRERYRNQNNPAVDLIRLVVANKAKNRAEQYDFVQYEQYEKMQLSLVNTPEKIRKNFFLRRYDFLATSLDTTVVRGKAAIPFYLNEVISMHYLRKSPKSRKKVIRAEKRVDFGTFVNNQGMLAYMKHVYQDIDIYDNNITIVTNQFLSPIADLAPTFYRFYLTDTINTADGRRLTELSFEPRNPAAFMFTGRIYISQDGNYAVQKAELYVGKTVAVNWIRNLKIALDFEQSGNGRYHLIKSDLRTDFAISQGSDGGFWGRRVVSYRNFTINQPHPESWYQEEEVQAHENTEEKDSSFWKLSRHDTLSVAEANTYTNIEKLAGQASFRRTMDWATALLAGYKSAGPNIEIGPLNTFYSFNPVEGFRLRLGGRTTPEFSNKLGLETYIAHGFRDRKWKYYLGGTYSFSDRSIYEFPIVAIKASYQKDTKIPGQELQFVQEDNFLLSFKRGENDKWLYNEIYTLDYLHEFRNHFSYKIGLKHWRQTPAGSLQYKSAATAAEEGPPLPEVQELTTTEVVLELRWAPHEEFLQGKIYRTPIRNRYPVFILRASSGIDGFLYGKHGYQNLGLNIFKRFYLSQLGYADVVGEAGYTFGQVSFPLLTIHRANQTYAYQLQSYNLMNFLEFISDQYASIHIDYTFNGFLFNKIPIIKKLKLREYITFKALWGSLRQESLPQNNPELLRFPVDDSGIALTHTLGREPYIEASVGIGNIFRVFRIDVVKRFTYLENPNVPDIGIRGRFKLDF
ncbi:DUF5686 and carboxypeptidase-like regulatory domain-containing protein [Cesiribacter sp. SM1]|uniref:DUF5686 and carboxypeptidase-like regulatory domain-containing protein n=1 Tax=Cesiribacter sp. SM1 TaxID=2861196 RepID=UPI001CD4D52A|nr:DUF5686 and carboxypeptidase-like regulatory domain-containing protein [Cesiribacter sp. SM1]